MRHWHRSLAGWPNSILSEAIGCFRPWLRNAGKAHCIFHHSFCSALKKETVGASSILSARWYVEHRGGLGDGPYWIYLCRNFRLDRGLELHLDGWGEPGAASSFCSWKAARSDYLERDAMHANGVMMMIMNAPFMYLWFIMQNSYC